MWQKVAKFKGAEYFRKALYYGPGLLPNRAIFCIPPLPCHNTTDCLKCIKKERNSTINKAHLLIEMHSS